MTAPNSIRILVVEDEPSIRDTIVYPLEADGFAVQAVGSGREALEKLGRETFALVVLDVGLPDMSGFEVCRQLRQQSDLPVVFLTARSEEIDRVVGLEIGGDDYMPKPFSPRELAARVRAILRRTGATNHRDSATSFVRLDEAKFQAYGNGQLLPLSRYEFRLLAALRAAGGRVLSRAQLMDAAWEEPEASMERTVDTHIKTLRAKLRSALPDHDPIRTHRGLGYSWEEAD